MELGVALCPCSPRCWTDPSPQCPQLHTFGGASFATLPMFHGHITHLGCLCPQTHWGLAILTSLSLPTSLSRSPLEEGVSLFLCPYPH